MENIDGSIEVGVENNSTTFASEGRASALAPIDVSADRAGSASILGSYELDCDSIIISFIDKKLLQLKEAPIGEEPILLTLMPSFPDSLELLKDNDSIFAYAVYQSPADAMVDITHKPLLFLPSLGQMPRRRTSAFAVQPASEIYISLFDIKSLKTVIEPTIGGSYNICDASVYSEEFAVALGLDCWSFYGNHQSEFSIPASDKIAFFGSPAQVSSEVFRNGERELDSSFHCKDIGNSFRQIECYTPSIVMDGCSKELGMPTPALMQSGLDRSASILVCDNSKLGRELESLTQGGIIEMMHTESVGLLMLVAGFNSKILGFCHNSKIIIENGSLCRSILNNCLERSHHISILCSQGYIRFAEDNALLQFLLWLKPEVSLQVIL